MKIFLFSVSDEWQGKGKGGHPRSRSKFAFEGWGEKNQTSTQKCQEHEHISETNAKRTRWYYNWSTTKLQVKKLKFDFYIVSKGQKALFDLIMEYWQLLFILVLVLKVIIYTSGFRQFLVLLGRLMREDVFSWTYILHLNIHSNLPKSHSKLVSTIAMSTHRVSFVLTFSKTIGVLLLLSPRCYLVSALFWLTVILVTLLLAALHSR